MASASRARIALYGISGLLFLLLLGVGWKVRSKVAEGWTFVGSDGFYYLGTAEELRVAHRYAMRLPQWAPDRDQPPPLTYCRVPGPSIVMALVAPPLPVQGYEPWYARVKVLHRVMDLGTCALVFFFGLLLFGPVAAWIGYLFTLFHPLLALYAASMLSETFATFLTTATMLPLCVAVSRKVSRRAFRILLIVGALLAGISTLVRIDSAVLLAPLCGAALLRREALRVRIGHLFGALLIFALVLSPWAARNYLRFEAPHISSTFCDTHGQPMARTAFMRWMLTWLTSEDQLPQTLWCALRPNCRLNSYAFPPAAFTDTDERNTVQKLFALHQSEGFSERVDAGFAKLAEARQKARPLRTRLLLPLERAKQLWRSPNDLPLRSVDHLPWPEMTQKITPKLPKIAFTIDELALFGFLFCLLLPVFLQTRRAALLIGGTVILRTAALALTGATEGRYLLEVLPLLLVLDGAALAAPFCAASARFR